MSYCDEKIISAEDVSRKLHSSDDKPAGTGPAHVGTKVQTDAGNEMLIHNTPNSGNVVTDAANMSDKWQNNGPVSIEGETSGRTTGRSASRARQVAEQLAGQHRGRDKWQNNGPVSIEGEPTVGTAMGASSGVGSGMTSYVTGGTCVGSAPSAQDHMSGMDKVKEAASAWDIPQ